MPRGDGTGPMGYGPSSGRGMGYCNGYGRPGYVSAGGPGGYGWSRRAGYGFGPGWAPRHHWHAAGWGFRRYHGRPGYVPFEEDPLNAEEEQELLREEATALKNRIKVLERRLAALDGPDEDAEDKEN